MKAIIRTGLSFSLLGAVLGLVACSSGGDGGSGFTAPNISHQPVAITTENESDVAQAGFDGANGGLAAGGSVPFSPLAISSANGSTSNNNGNVYNIVKRVVTNGIRTDLTRTGTASVTGIQISDSAPCSDGGSESFSASIADFNQQTEEPNSISVGDYISISYANCNEGFGEVLNGSMTMTFNSAMSLAELNSASNINFSITASFNNFSVMESGFGTVAMHGSMDISTVLSNGNFTFTMSGDSFYAVAPDESVHLTNFDMSISVNESTNDSVVDSTFTVASTAINGQITVDSHLETAGFAMYPHTGYMNISGNNSQLNVVVDSVSSVTVTLMINGATEAGYPKTISWAELGVEVDNVV